MNFEMKYELWSHPGWWRDASAMLIAMHGASSNSGCQATGDEWCIRGPSDRITVTSFLKPVVRHRAKPAQCLDERRQGWRLLAVTAYGTKHSMESEGHR